MILKGNINEVMDLLKDMLLAVGDCKLVEVIR